MRFYKRPDSPFYFVVYRTETGVRRISTACENLEDAEKMAREANIEAIELSAKFLRKTQRKAIMITVAEAAELWFKHMPTVNRSDNTVANYSMSLRSFIRAHGELPPSAITVKQCAEWVRWLTGKLSTRSVALAALRGLFEFCRDSGWCQGNPARLVEINLKALSHDEKETEERIPFTDEEVARILAFTKDGDPYISRAGKLTLVSPNALNFGPRTPFWHVATAIGRYAGLRLGDVCQLEWASLRVPDKLIVWTGKHDRRVEMPMPPELQSYLWLIVPHRNPESPDARWCFPAMRIRYLAARWKAPSLEFTKICRYLGIYEGKGFHCLRHRYAQDERENGVELPDLAEKMGHAHWSTTKGYTHE